jgi:hypothetical protein
MAMAPPAGLGTRIDRYRCCLPALAGVSGRVCAALPRAATNAWPWMAGPGGPKSVAAPPWKASAVLKKQIPRCARDDREELCFAFADSPAGAKPPWQGGAAKPQGSEVRAWGPRFAKRTLGFMGEAHEWRWPRRLASAPASTDTVAAFRPWRGFRSSVARGRRGHHRRCISDADELETGGERGCIRHIHVPHPLRGGFAVQIGNPADLSNPRGFSPPLRRVARLRRRVEDPLL